jgi:hypothetical protein
MVNSVFAGSVPGNAGTILVAQAGGKWNNWDISVKGDPLFSPGDRYILFLVPDERPSLPNVSGMPRYAVVGVWSGRVNITSGKAVWAAAADQQLHASDGTPVDVFLQTLRQTIQHPYTNPNLPINPPPSKRQ